MSMEINIPVHLITITKYPRLNKELCIYAIYAMCTHVHNVFNVHATSNVYQVSFAFDVSLVPCALCVHVAHVHFLYFCLMCTMCTHVHRIQV